jgi:hypothetical protein
MIKVLDLHNQFKEYLQEGEKYNLICKFKKNTFIYLFNRLSCSFQTEKLYYFIKKIYSITKFDLKDHSFLKIILNFLKTFIVNKDFEIFIDKGYAYKLNNLPSQVVINFLALKNKNTKKVFENMKSKKINVYQPYLYFKHNKIFEFLIQVLKSDLTNTHIGEEILELFYIYLKNIYFFKCLPNEILLKIILDEENLKKYLSNKKFFELLVKIIIISPFDYTSFSSNTQLNPKNTIKTSYEFFKMESTRKLLSDIISMNSDKLKDKMLDYCANSLKEILKSMKNIVSNYRKCLNMQLKGRESSLNNNNNNLSPNLNFNHNIFIGAYEIFNQAHGQGQGKNINSNSFANPSSNYNNNQFPNGNNLLQNPFIFYNPKEKIINLNNLTEANIKEDVLNNYKDNRYQQANQANFKNCKNFMNKVLIIIRIYFQSYFQYYMSDVLHSHLDLNKISNTDFSLNYNNNNEININNSSFNFNNNLNGISPASSSHLINNANNSLNISNINYINNNNNFKFNDIDIKNQLNILNQNQNLLNTIYRNQIDLLNNIANSQNFSLLNLNDNLNLQSENGNNNSNNKIISQSLFNINFLSNLPKNENINLENLNNEIFSNLKQNYNYNSSPLNFLNNTINNLNSSLTSSSINPNINKNFQELNNNQNEINNNNFFNHTNNLTNKINNLNYDYNSNKENNTNESERLKHLTNLYNNLFEYLFDIRNLAYFKPSLSISILYTLFSLKDVISKFGNELILKTIYLALNIGWTQYETEINKIFNEIFNIKFKNFEYEKIRAFEPPLKKEFINFLSDIIVLSLINKTSNGNDILYALNTILKNKSNYRESILLDLCRWNIISKSIRDNMKNEYRNKIQDNSLVFIGEK